MFTPYENQCNLTGACNTGINTDTMVFLGTAGITYDLYNGYSSPFEWIWMSMPL